MNHKSNILKPLKFRGGFFFIIIFLTVFATDAIHAQTLNSPPYGMTSEKWQNLQQQTTRFKMRDISIENSVFINGGFETGDFAEWITEDLTMAFFPLSVGGTGINLGSGFFTSAPTEGALAALHGFDGNGPGTIVIAQDIALSSGAMTLEFDYRAAWDLVSFCDGCSGSRIFMVNIEPAGGGTPLQSDTLLIAEPNTQMLDTGNLHGTIDVSAFASNSIRISFDWFVPESFTGPGFFQLDDVFVVETGPQIRVSPNLISFSNVETDDSSHVIVALRNIGTADLTVSSISGPGAPFALSRLPALPVVIPSGGSETFDVTFSPSSPGTASATITISSNDADDPTVDTKLTGQGVVLSLADPGVCYATTGRRGDNPGSLLTLDLATGAGTLIGPTGLVAAPGLAINSSGEMFCTPGFRGADLYRIDAASGAAVFVGSTGLLLLDAIAFDGNDVLYGIGFESVDWKLYTINAETGVTTAVANIAVPGLIGMAFDPTDGTLYASTGGNAPIKDRIVTLDVTTGQASLVGVTGFGRATPDIHFDQDGNLYGVTGGGQSNNALLSIDKATGAGTAIGAIGFVAVSGLATRLDRAVVSVKDDQLQLPKEFALEQNHPNPFNPTTNIVYELPVGARVKLEVFNMLGQKVRTLVNKDQAVGLHQIQWDGMDDGGLRVGSGLYIYRLNAGTFSESRKMLLLK